MATILAERAFDGWILETHRNCVTCSMEVTTVLRSIPELTVVRIPTF